MVRFSTIIIVELKKIVFLGNFLPLKSVWTTLLHLVDKIPCRILNPTITLVLIDHLNHPTMVLFDCFI